MLIQEFCQLAGFDEKAENILAPFWNRAVETFPGLPEFLTVEFIEKYYPLTKGRPEALPFLREVAEKVKELPSVQLYAWLLHRGFFLESERGKFSELPLLTSLLGDRAGILQLMVAMSSIPLILKKVKELGLPESYAHEMMRWIGGTIEIYAAAHNGMPGHDFGQTHWCRHYIDGELFRIGRLEYLLHPLPEYVPAIYRRRSDGRALALCRDGWIFNSAGLREKEESDSTVTARLEIYRDKVCGMPISPYGHAIVNRREELDLNEWEALVSPWELAPSVHIPVGGGMTPEAVTSSMKEAVKFLNKQFHCEIKVFVCFSWIFNTDWETELPESNLTKFMQLLYLTPGLPSAGRDGLFFIFGRDKDEDWSHYQEETSLQRAFHNLRRSGRKLKNGGMFILTEDLPRLKPGFYREQWNA